MHIVFSIATRPPRCHAFGLELKPPTLGHLLLLREYECCAFQPGTKLELSDFLLASFVCAADHRKSRKHLQSGWRLTWFLKYWGFKCRKMDLKQEALRFLQYRRTFIACPQAKNVGNGLLRTPDEYRSLAFLMAELHMSRLEAEDAELAWITAMWASNGDRTGKVDLISVQEEAGLQAAFAHQRKLDLAKRMETACSA